MIIKRFKKIKKDRTVFWYIPGKLTYVFSFVYAFDGHSDADVLKQAKQVCDHIRWSNFHSLVIDFSGCHNILMPEKILYFVKLIIDEITSQHVKVYLPRTVPTTAFRAVSKYQNVVITNSNDNFRDPKEDEMEALVTYLLTNFGEPVMKGVQRYSKFLNIYEIPLNGKKKIRVYMNKYLYQVLTEIFSDTVSAEIWFKEVREIQCYNVRKKRGNNEWSVHSYGLALDINPSNNLMGYNFQDLKKNGLKPLSDAFCQMMKKYGFESGSDFSFPDRMHFQVSKAKLSNLMKMEVENERHSKDQS